MDLRTLTSLVDKCLVTHRPNGRYELHELLRQFAAEKLSKDPQDEVRTRTAHSHFFLDYIRKLDFMGPEMAANIPLVQADLDNLRTAWFSAAGRGDYAVLDAACDPLFDFYIVMVWYSQALTLLEETLSILPGSPPAHFLTWLLTKKASRLITLGKESDGLKILFQAQELADRNNLRAIKARIHKTMALTQFNDDFQESIHNYEKSKAIDQEFEERGSIAHSIMWMGIVWFTKGFLSKGEACFYDSLRLCREIHFLNMELHNVRMLVTTSLVKGDLLAAAALNQELQEIVAKIGVAAVEAYPLSARGLLAWRQKDFTLANCSLEQCLQILQQQADLGEKGWLPVKAHYHILYCQVLEDEGEYAEMHLQALQALALYQRVGFYHEWSYPLLEPLNLAGARRDASGRLRLRPPAPHPVHPRLPGEPLHRLGALRIVFLYRPAGKGRPLTQSARPWLSSCSASCSATPAWRVPTTTPPSSASPPCPPSTRLPMSSPPLSPLMRLRQLRSEAAT